MGPVLAPPWESRPRTKTRQLLEQNANGLEEDADHFKALAPNDLADEVRGAIEAELDLEILDAIPCGGAAGVAKRWRLPSMMTRAWKTRRCSRIPGS